MAFECIKTDFEGAYLINTFYSMDSRGGFVKCFEKDIYKQLGIEFELNETFYSISAKNVMRGLHFQKNHPQDKLVTVVKGAILDVIVDIRRDSKTFGHWQIFELNEENHSVLFVPAGFAHGFISLEDKTIMLYQCHEPYDKETDTGISILDYDIGIKWPVDVKDVIMSDRDKELMSFEEYCRLEG